MGKFERKLKRKKIKEFKKYLKEETKQALLQAKALEFTKYIKFMIEKIKNNNITNKEKEEFEKFAKSNIFGIIPLNSVLNNEQKKILIDFLKDNSIKWNVENIIFKCENCGKEYKRYSSFEKHKEKCKES